MIDPLVFKASRELARSKLSKQEAANSFGYWIDVQNHWENYQKPSELVDFLTIHRTHAVKLPEFIEDVGSLTQLEQQLVEQYIQTYSNITRLLTTTGNYGDFRHDIVESIITWRVIKSFHDGPMNILDFGAGAARYGVLAHLDSPNNTYTALDATLAAYTLQNLVLSYLDITSHSASFFEYLDFEVLGRNSPAIEDISQNKRVHLPTWVAKEHLRERWQDVVILSHVHGELSAEDFTRLLEFVQLSLADEGIVVVRSELTWGDIKDYWNTIDLHGIELFIELNKIDILPIYTESLGGYLTTVFARKDSQQYRNNIENQPTLQAIDTSRDLTLLAARNYVYKHIESVINANRKTLVIGHDTPLFEQFMGQELSALPSSTLQKESFLDHLNDNVKSIDEAEVIVLYSERFRSYARCLEIKANLQQLSNVEFEILRAYPFYGVVVLSKAFLKEVEPLLLSPIYDHSNLPKGGL